MESQNDILSADISKEEIVNVVAALATNEARGPDWFTIAFYQQMSPTVNHDTSLQYSISSGTLNYPPSGLKLQLY